LVKFFSLLREHFLKHRVLDLKLSLCYFCNYTDIKINCQFSMFRIVIFSILTKTNSSALWDQFPKQKGPVYSNLFNSIVITRNCASLWCGMSTYLSLVQPRALLSAQSWTIRPRKSWGKVIFIKLPEIQPQKGQKSQFCENSPQSRESWIWNFR
jgi:hypothetical protein